MLSYGSYSPETAEEENIYYKDIIYPEEPVTYHTGGGLSNNSYKTFLVVRVYPVRYLPLRNQIEYIQDVKIDIIYKATSENLLPNNQEKDLLIIAPKVFKNRLQPLVTHKNKMGIQTKLTTVEDVYKQVSAGRDNPEKIKYYIKNAIETIGIKYVLLVGGIKRQTDKWNIPIRLSYVIPPKEQEYPEKSFISDLYYADIYNSKGEFCSWDSNNNGIFAEWNEDGKDEMDNYPDVYLGRLPCRDIFQVKTMVDKIINYEKSNVKQKSWFKNLILVAGDSYDDKNYFNEGELICDRAIELVPGSNPVKVYASETQINYKTINNVFSNGGSFAYICGHGSQTSWGTHYPPDGTRWTEYYSVIHMNLLRNKEKLPIGVIGGCLNGKIDKSITKNIKSGVEKFGLINYFLTKFFPGGLIGQCWAWKLTVIRGGGTIATISNTGLGTHGRDDTNHNGIADYLEVLNGWQELRFMELYGKEGKDILGENHGQTITEYLHYFSGNNDKMDIKMAQQWLLFGDPTLKIGGYSAN